MDKKILILEELKRYAIDTASRIRKLSTEKVDKQDGKGLSSNDFTTSEKEKLKDIGIATEDKPGLVKPDGDTITMDMDGTLHGSSQVSIMTGATASSDGSTGSVPKPTAGEQSKFLRGDGSWADTGVSDLQTKVEEMDTNKANLDSPFFTGIPKAQTAASGTNTTQLATTAFVQAAVSAAIAAADAMIMKGTIGTTGTVSTLPTTYYTGWTYRVVTAGTYAGQVCEIGDLIIALVDRFGSGNVDSDWCVAQTNINGAITGIKTGDGIISVSQTGSVVTVSHNDVARKDSTSTVSPEGGETFTVIDSVISDAKGHITKVNVKTVTMPTIPEGTGSGSSTGANAQTAVKLETARNIQVQLDSEMPEAFDGSKDVNPGVTGVLPVWNGGTGADNSTTAEYNILGGVETVDDLIDNDERYFAVRNDEISEENGTFRWFKISNLWEYVKGKIITVFGINTNNYNGNAATATKLKTARQIELTGSVTGVGNFDGSGNIAINVSTNHDHKYAGASTAGGSANSAAKLDSSAGSATRPVYFSEGKPVECTYTVEKSVPSNAVFTDTTYGVSTESSNGLMTAEDKKKLNGIAAGANAYTHPTTSGHRHIPEGGAEGQILRWSGDGDAVWGNDNNTHYTTGITAGASGTTANTAATNPYVKIKDDSTHRGQIRLIGSGATGVSSDASGNVTITSTNTTYGVATTSANGLMTAEDKKKLNGIATGANAYTHPTTSGNKHIPSGGSSGQILRWSADGTAAWGNDKDTTYAAATQSANGLMSAADKKKLDGVAAGANAYTHPTTSGNKHIPSGGSAGQILRWSGDGNAVWGNDNNTTYGVATQSANGLMSAADKKKLDGIAAGAGKTTVDAGLSSTSTNPVQNKVVNDAIKTRMARVNPFFSGTMIRVGTDYSPDTDSVCFGVNCKVLGKYSFVEGEHNTVSGESSHAEGAYNTVSREYNHAEGYGNTVSGNFSHAEGAYNTVSGNNSHAEGVHNTVSEHNSHAEGLKTEALGYLSHTAGCYTQAYDYQFAIGHFNSTSSANASTCSGSGSGSSFIIGNGSQNSRSNAFRVTDAGATYAKAAYNSTGADYAEFFEWADENTNNEDRRGYFVTISDKKIKIADENDYILGIVSGQPSIIGNSDEEWMGRYVLDEFGSFITEVVEYNEERVDEETGETITVPVKYTKYKENPDYDSSRLYEQRMDRKEWAAVGLLGVLSLRDDGSCKVNGFCKPTHGGIATSSEYDINSYRVIERVSENVIKVVLK